MIHSEALLGKEKLQGCLSIKSLYLDKFLSCGVSLKETDGPHRNGKLLGQEGAEGLIGFSFHRGRMDFHFQGLAQPSDHLAPGSIRDSSDFETAGGHPSNQAKAVSSLAWSPSKAPLLSTTRTSPS